MLKLIVLLLGLGIGFGGGVYWAHHNPDAAAKLAAEEEKKFLEAQLALNQKIQAKLEQLQGKAAGKVTGSGFLSGAQSGGAAAAEVNEVKSEAQKQEDELQKRLAKLK